MNAESYSSQMCEEATIDDTQLLKYKNPPFAVPLLTSSTADEDNKDSTTTVEETYIMPPVYDSDGIKLEGSKNALLYAYMSDEAEDPTTYQRGLRRIVYAIGYPFNGFQMFNCGITAGALFLQVSEKCTFEVAPMGRHIGDWEHVTVFVKIKDAELDSNHPENYELYCIYSSQHDAYNIGLANTYYEKYNDNNDTSFKQEFDHSNGYLGMKEKVTINLPDIDATNFNVQDYINTIINNLNEYVKFEKQEVSQIETDADNNNQAIIYSSFNGHPNHFAQNIFPLFDLNVKIILRQIPFVINFSGCDVTTLSKDTNAQVGDCFLYPTSAETQIKQAQAQVEAKDAAESKKADDAVDELLSRIIR